MTDLFLPSASDNLLPYDGIVNDFGVIIKDSYKLYEQLLVELPWQSDQVTLFGKTHITKRQIVWMGYNSANKMQSGTFTYTYSGHTRTTIAWHNAVLHVKQMTECLLLKQDIPVQFNTCLLNYYPSGSEGMGFHADDEPELGYHPIIASLSFGATRKFVLKHKKTQHKVELFLESGQCIVMRGDTQHHWKHTITKTKKVTEGRISLTFRNMHPL